MARYGRIAVYLLANRKNGTLCCGVASDLAARMQQHHAGSGSAFARKYGCDTLVWFEAFPTMNEAIAFEKRLKRWRCAWKIDLIEASNPDWRDRSGDL